MKRNFYLTLLLLFVIWVTAQNYKLIESRHIADNSKDCRKIGNCISAKNLNHDTLTVSVYTDNQDRDLNAFRDSFTLDQDTLSLNLIDTNAIRYSYVFNKEKTS